jgi:hypothetical protein
MADCNAMETQPLGRCGVARRSQRAALKARGQVKQRGAAKGDGVKPRALGEAASRAATEASTAT